MLAVAGVAAALVSDWFANSLTPALSALHISQAFAGLVIVAIAGNAVENFVGIQLAARNRMDYALSVTLQSPVQIALGIAPLLVLISAGLGGAQLTLVFPPLMIVALALTAIVATLVVFDGNSTWIEGTCLIGLYVVSPPPSGGAERGRDSLSSWRRLVAQLLEAEGYPDPPGLLDLALEAFQMAVDGAFRNAEQLGYLGVGVALDDQARHFFLAPGQALRTADGQRPVGRAGMGGEPGTDVPRPAATARIAIAYSCAAACLVR